MKKITLCAIALMASATSFAQTILWNGEDKELGKTNTGVWEDRCAPEVVENPSKAGVNTSDKCLKFTITGTDWNNGNTAFGLPTGTNFSSKRLSLKMKKDDNTNVRVELTFKEGETNVYKKVAAWYDGAGEWRTLYFDFSTNNASDAPTEIAIYPTTDGVTGEKIVYVDDIQIEDLPKVGGAYLNDLAEGSLSDNITLNGTWIKGECQNVDGEWQKVEYNDFATLNSKLSANVTSVDMRGTVTKNVDVNKFFENKNPNTIVYADEAYEHNNVVANGNAANVVLTDDKAFAILENFNAAEVSLTRNMREGINSFVLPFWVNPDELGATKLATYKKSKSDGNKVIFEVKDKTVGVNANTPFITCDVAAGKAGDDVTLSFVNKGFVVTPTSFDGAFKGVYTPQSAKDLYGIDENGNLHKGGESAKINAFHAYYQGTPASAKISFEGEATGINAVTTTSTSANGAVYDLSGRRVAASLAAAKLAKGIYVVNGKKVAVK